MAFCSLTTEREEVSYTSHLSISQILLENITVLTTLQSGVEAHKQTNSPVE